MHPQKFAGGRGSAARDSMRHESTPSSSDSLQPNFASQHSLPSIRQLHPYLLPSGLSQQHPSGSGEGSSLMYSAPSQFVPQPSPSDRSLLGSRKSPEISALDSEPDLGEQSREPPKKKRRRQALSCTECKRRKIKCDRTQPCTPCTRRGEQSRCQWHVVEPIEKYVTRAEFDDLKGRYDELFKQVQRLQAAQVPPFYHMGNPPGLLGEAVLSTGPSAYQPLIFPSQSFNPSTQSQGPRSIKPEDTQIQSRHHTSTSVISPVLTRSPSSMRPFPSDKSPTSSAAKTSPLSLASITSPFNSDSQSKNCHAQALVLGKRTSPAMYLSNLASASQKKSANQIQPPSRRFMEPPLQANALSRDDDRESLVHFAREH
ncbi:hypothetical protein E4T56_gene19275 [Termitomyces sp. T112]|nr:hypothetical protein E4T56_gene19275 [Termitomyces sp. T112]